MNMVCFCIYRYFKINSVFTVVHDVSYRLIIDAFYQVEEAHLFYICSDFVSIYIYIFCVYGDDYVEFLWVWWLLGGGGYTGAKC